MRIAILEDDPDQLALVKHWLRDAGHEIHGYMRGRDLMRAATRESMDLFLLDWQVPDVPGTDVVVWIREKLSKTVPVLFMTVRDTEADIVFALERGADDYMVKPLRRQEMLARLNALLRRAYPLEQKALLEFPPFLIDTARKKISRGGHDIALRPKEFELAVVLFRNVGRLLSRGHLQELVWGKSGELATRTVDMHVSQVRKKLELKPESSYQVVPVYNYGYRLEKV
jgi:DNA-binding response OmpR family regulator